MTVKKIRDNNIKQHIITVIMKMSSRIKNNNNNKIIMIMINIIITII